MDKNKYFLTGEFAKIANVTKNTLFHYDKIGLFSPEIKMDNEYRYYSMQQLETIQIILMLKDLGMPLSEIKEYLDGNSTEDLLELYDKELVQIQKRIRQLKQKENWITRQKEQILAFSKTDLSRIYICTLQNRYAFFAHSSSTDERSLAKKAGSLIAKYNQLCQPIGYKISYIQHMEDIENRIYDNYHDVLLIFYTKPKNTSTQILPAGDYLTAYHKGHWDSIGEAYKRLLSYADSHHLQLADDFLETEIVDRLYVKDRSNYVTEIAVRILPN